MAWSARDDKPVRRTFGSLSEAKGWRQETQVALRKGSMGAPSDVLVREAAGEWVRAAQAGVVRARGGHPYKPSALRTYKEALYKRLLPRFGHLRLSALTRQRVQQFVDDLVAEGLAASSVRNNVLPLRAIYRRAVHNGLVTTNPTFNLLLPAVRGRRDRVARPAEARALLDALPEGDRALWATALYAGLRRGELQALRWEDIHFDRGVIDVRYGWDRVEGVIEPKSHAGGRRVPISQTLRRYLLVHHNQHPDHRGFVFSATGERPFDPPTTTGRAKRCWQHVGLNPILLHECRHTYASLMIAAGVSPKALSAYMGHSTISLTLDRYAHLLPGNETEAAHLLDTLLDLDRHPDRPTLRLAAATAEPEHLTPRA